MRLGTAKLAALALADAGVLVAARPGTALLHDLAAPRDWLARVGADAATARLAAAGLWLVAAWVAIGLLAAIAAHLPGTAGRVAARFAAVTLPRAVLRLVAGAAGLGVLVAPVAATAAAAPSTPAWPTSAAPSAPAWPTTPTTPAKPTGAPRHPPIDHPTTGPTHERDPHLPITVRAGDSLWSIAAEHLPADQRVPARIAAAWPHWYAANRRAIGSDPDHIEVGRHLQPPTAPRTEPGR
jgi:hypothetical protein